MAYREKFVHGMKHYLSGLFLVWLAILFYRYNSYYAGFLLDQTQKTLFFLALVYTLFGFLFYVFMPIEKIQGSKGLTILRMFKKILREFYFYIKNFIENQEHKLPRIDKQEKVTLLFLLVKIFFLPIMLNFFYANLNAVRSSFPRILELSSILSIDSFNNFLYPLFLSSIFLLDTLWFSFGYTFEARFMKNTIRSVEPTVFGWVVALVCYPPFVGLFSGYASWYANDYAIFSSSVVTLIARIFVILFLLIYLFATFALGAKCSNLTNRGIVSRGPYKYVRHPAYISKNLAWWITIIPVLGFFSILSMATWSFIYFLRAITEERHLIQDPDYRDYCKKVKYRFIPGIY